MPKNDVTGERFGSLVALLIVGNSKNGGSIWLCKCDCGEEKSIPIGNLKTGNTKSCGCYRRNIKKRHGMNNTRLAHCYDSMKTRCYNNNYQRYDRYGGRGITVCDEWRESIGTFINWAIQNGYREDLTLDRIDNDGNYEPSNCRWVTMKEQSRNTQVTIFVEYSGEVKTLQEWSEIFHLNSRTVYTRWKAGKREDDLFTPVRRSKNAG